MHASLLDDHRRIRELAGALARQAAEPRMPVASEFASTRWALARELMRHHALEASVFGAERANGQGAARYRQHMAQWLPAEIDGQWRAFRDDLRAVLRQVESDMLREERELYPQLAPRTDRAAS